MRPKTNGAGAGAGAGCMWLAIYFFLIVTTFYVYKIHSPVNSNVRNLVYWGLIGYHYALTFYLVAILKGWTQSTTGIIDLFRYISSTVLGIVFAIVLFAVYEIYQGTADQQAEAVAALAVIILLVSPMILLDVTFLQYSKPTPAPSCGEQIVPVQIPQNEENAQIIERHEKAQALI